MLDEYYDYRGLSQDGLPTRQRLEEIDLKPVADTLDHEHLLGETRSCLPMSAIVTNPEGKDFGRNLLSRIISRMERRMMKKMEDPGFYRRFLEKQARKIEARRHKAMKNGNI